MRTVSFIIDNILTQTPITIASIAMLGLPLQEKPIGQVISGAFKTLLGSMVLLVGSSAIMQVLTYFGVIFVEGFGMQGLVSSIEVINGQIMGEPGPESEIALTLRAILIFSTVIVCFTEQKYILLTGQVLLRMPTTCAVFKYWCGLCGVMSISVGGSIGGIFAVVVPVTTQSYVRKTTSNDDTAFGHFCIVGHILTVQVGKLTGGKKSVSIEELQLPKGLEFLQDACLSIGTAMIPLFLVTALFAGPKSCTGYAGATDYPVRVFLRTVQLVVGVYILLAGVRLLLVGIIPTFRGIAMKLAPDVKPTLSYPVLFPYAPSAVTTGFVSITTGSVIDMLFPLILGLPMISPGMMVSFFAGDCAGILGNATGGTRDYIISGITHGLSITFLPTILPSMLADVGSPNVTYTDVGTIVCGLLYGWLSEPVSDLSQEFIYVL